MTNRLRRMAFCQLARMYCVCSSNEEFRQQRSLAYLHSCAGRQDLFQGNWAWLASDIAGRNVTDDARRTCGWYP